MVLNTNLFLIKPFLITKFDWMYLMEEKKYMFCKKKKISFTYVSAVHMHKGHKLEEYMN